jgi:hypothetical protein
MQQTWFEHLQLAVDWHALMRGCIETSRSVRPQDAWQSLRNSGPATSLLSLQVRFEGGHRLMSRLLALALTMSLLLVAAELATAEVVNVTASADSTVDFKQPTINIQGDLLARKEGDEPNTADQLTFVYAQFDLPGGLTGQQIQSVNSAQLAVSRLGPNLSLTYYVYGIFDGLDTAGANTYDWNDGIGFNPAETLVKFLTPDHITYYTDPAEASHVGTIDTATPGTGPYNFTSTPQSPGAVTALTNLIQNDTDGRVTFFIGVRQPFGVTNLNPFASIENGTLPGPTLTIDFVRVPEPGAWLLGLGGLAAVAGLTRKLQK